VWVRQRRPESDRPAQRHTGRIGASAYPGFATRQRRLRESGYNFSALEDIRADDDQDLRGRAGRQFDDLHEASRTGHIGAGAMYRLGPQNG
jgi:hypothetical protein